MSGPLLAVDGDSFAHRAYHGMPKTFRRDGGRPDGAITGFGMMLLRLWEAERPAVVVVGWDSLGSPTYRNTEFPSYQGGREFDADLLEQLELLPGLPAALQPLRFEDVLHLSEATLDIVVDQDIVIAVPVADL